MAQKGNERVRFFRNVAVVGLVLACFTARGEAAADCSAGKGVIPGWYSFLGSWNITCTWEGLPPASFVMTFSPSGLAYEDGTLAGVWSQVGDFMNWQYEEGTLYRGKILSNYAMNGTMSTEWAAAGTWTASRSYAPGVVSFLYASNSVQEGTTKTIFVYRTYGNDGVVSINYSVAQGSALAMQDYQPKSGTLTWRDKDSSLKAIKIPVYADGKAEGTETFSVVLKKPVNGYLGSPAKATVYILPSKAGL